MNAGCPRIRRLVIVGLGLIGGSFALAAKRSRLVDTVVGVSQTPATLEKGLSLGVIDEAADDYRAALQGADLVFIATPMGAFESVLTAMKPYIASDLVITDGGSVKAGVIDSIERVFGELPSNFVLGHPIAGSENSGVTAARADLYDNHKVILTPTASTDADALHWVREIWMRIGAEVHLMDPVRHDDVLAVTSHLPHLLAYSLVDTLGADQDNREIFRYAAGGFRDFTRIAASDPVMWRDIFLTNRTATLSAIDRFQAGLERLKQAVADEDAEAMAGVFTRAQSCRRHFAKMLARETWQDSPSNSDRTLSVTGNALIGRVVLPGDQSRAYRAIILAALSTEIWELDGISPSEDNQATIQALRDMGVVIEELADAKVRIFGVGLYGLKPPPGPLYMGGSTTMLWLFCGLLAGQRFSSELVGSEALMNSPVSEVTGPLKRMGAQLESAGGHPPLKIHGGQSLSGIDLKLERPSARVKTAVILAGLYASSPSTIREPVATRNHMEVLMQTMGFPEVVTVESENHLRVDPTPLMEPVPARGQQSTVRQLSLAGDTVLAVNLAVAALCTKGSELVLENVGLESSRMQAVSCLQAMGGSISVESIAEQGAPSIGRWQIRASRLRSIELDLADLLQVKQEIPALMFAAAHANGPSVFRGLAGLDAYDSLLVQRMKSAGKVLSQLGVEVVWSADACTITGLADAASLSLPSSLDVGSNGLVGLAALLSAGHCAAKHGRVITHDGGVLEDYPALLGIIENLGWTLSVEHC